MEVERGLVFVGGLSDGMGWDGIGKKVVRVWGLDW